MIPKDICLFFLPILLKSFEQLFDFLYKLSYVIAWPLLLLFCKSLDSGVFFSALKIGITKLVQNYFFSHIKRSINYNKLPSYYKTLLSF